MLEQLAELQVVLSGQALKRLMKVGGLIQNRSGRPAKQLNFCSILPAAIARSPASCRDRVPVRWLLSIVTIMCRFIYISDYGIVDDVQFVLPKQLDTVQDFLKTK